MESKNGVIVLGGFIQALALLRSMNELGVPVYIAEENLCIAGVSRYCKKFLKAPASESPELITFLIEIAKKDHLKDWFLFPTDDHQVENLSRNINVLQEYYKLLVPSPKELTSIINKKELMKKAKACGTNTPNTCDTESVENARDFRYPVIVKGNYGQSFFLTMHKKAFIVDSYQDLQAVLGTVSKSIDVHDVMIQELIPTRKGEHVVSFTCFADCGEIKTYWMGQKLRERPIDNGTATFAESVMVEGLLEQAKPLMKSLQFSGVCEIEFMYDHRDNRWNLIEINPRTWKWVGLAKACGVDYAKMIYRYVYQIEQSYPSSYELGVKWVDHLTDVFVVLKMVKARRLTVSGYFNSLRGKVIPAAWCWKDPLPALYFPFYSVGCILKRKRQ